jgi:hypothetical protein
MNVKTDLLFSTLQASTPVKNKRKVAQENESLLAFAVESMTSDAGVPRRIDRIGRPEITNVSMNMNTATSGGEIRDAYNADRPFEVPQANYDRYMSRLNQMISRYDMIDQKQDWNPAQLNQLTTLLTDDFLVLDLSIPCDHSEFFSIEKSLLQGKTPHSCGGRDPNDNVTNKLYTLFEHGPNNPNDVSADAQDGLTGTTIPLSNKFPYLNPPDDSISAAIKRQIVVLFGP